MVAIGWSYWCGSLAGGVPWGYCDFGDHSTVTAAVAGRTGVVVPVERLVPATGAVNLTLTPVPGYRELP
ncbi:hypothetical protein [Lacticaseibacillus pantheris]|uniref:Uncharacterized protein n=1 Tax=Lacticaseibacillus pantheris DSM 15945 = JCM 12539 = NBRC 106106 TaxID=1423783 RepID=A0A0R1U3I4_9LACO|nr:hypothetical protein [Lacticaseibacillus pantheris]KRL87550.1 hypothetical protein FC50_GL002266 [Lacticaseibacillus pantheris DSM 15945 = JCM 12539 = NBRC 106106]WKF85045.1 hypothetical protein QY874_00090 [Lacticaseibacillus pantheris]